MNEKNFHDDYKDLKLKSILNKPGTYSRKRNSSSSSKKVVIVEPNVENNSLNSKKKIISLKDQKKKIKKILRPIENNNLEEDIFIKSNELDNKNNNNLNYEDSHNRIIINKILMRKKKYNINPIEKNFQLFQKFYLILNIFGLILSIFLIYHIYNIFSLFSIFNNMYIYLSCLEVIFLFIICFLNINLCLKENNNDYSEQFNSYMKNSYYKSIFINTCQMGLTIFIFYIANYYNTSIWDKIYKYLQEESLINIFYFILIFIELGILIINLFLEEYYNLQVKDENDIENDLRECLL